MQEIKTHINIYDSRVRKFLIWGIWRIISLKEIFGSGYMFRLSYKTEDITLTSKPIVSIPPPLSLSLSFADRSHDRNVDSGGMTNACLNDLLAKYIFNNTISNFYFHNNQYCRMDI